MDYVVSTWAMTKGIDQEKVGKGMARSENNYSSFVYTVHCTAIRI